MTPLPCFDELVVERRDLPEYEIPPRCANPRCPNMADDKHEIYPRSQAVGVVWWIELPGRFLIGNRVGLCRTDHETNDAHTTQIIWDDTTSRLAWVDFKERWAEPLDPMPPIHKIDSGVPPSILGRPRTDGLPDDAPELYEPDVDEVIRGEQFIPESEATGPVTTPVAGGPGEAESGPPHSAAGTGLANEPVPSASPASEQELLARRIRATDALLREIEEGVRAVEPLEPVEDEIVPVSVPELPEPEILLPKGDDAATVARAVAATEEAREHAEAMKDVPAVFRQEWLASVLVSPQEKTVKVQSGDLRVGIFLEEQLELAKRAPKKREPRPPEDPDREREPAKAKRTWSIAVPVEAREDGLVELEEDGYNEIENALDDLRQRFGDSDDPGWKFRVLVKALAWMQLHYTSEGED